MYEFKLSKSLDKQKFRKKLNHYLVFINNSKFKFLFQFEKKLFFLFKSNFKSFSLFLI